MRVLWAIGIQIFVESRQVPHRHLRHGKYGNISSFIVATVDIPPKSSMASVLKIGALPFCSQLVILLSEAYGSGSALGMQGEGTHRYIPVRSGESPSSRYKCDATMVAVAPEDLFAIINFIVVFFLGVGKGHLRSTKDKSLYGIGI